jgi:diamine N-acetyltransferase
MPTYRLADPTDAPRLAALAERTFRDAFASFNTAANMDLHCQAFYGAEIQAREILEAATTTMIAEQEGEFIGYLRLRRKSPPVDLPCANPVELQRLYVDRRWHGQGVAHQLMAEALRLAKIDGADKIWLGVWAHNPRALAFYQKSGFTAAGEHVFPVGHDPQRDIIMVRPVDG